MKLSLFLLSLLLTLTLSELPEGYVNIDLEEFYSNIMIQDLVNFGAQHIINTGIDNGNLPDTEYFITQVYSIAKQELKDQDKANYAFDVMLVDQDGSAIRGNYIISHCPSTQAQEVVSFAYDEDYYTEDAEIVSSDDSEDEELPFEEILTGTYLSVNESAEWLRDVWFTEDELVDEKGLIITGSPTSISLDKFNSDPDVQNLFLFGLEEVLEQIVPQEIGISQFHVSNIYDVKKQVVNGISYIFDTEVENSQGVSIRATFEVYSQSWTGVMEVLSYTYAITDTDGSIYSGEESFIDF